MRGFLAGSINCEAGTCREEEGDTMVDSCSERSRGLLVSACVSLIYELGVNAIPVRL